MYQKLKLRGVFCITIQKILLISPPNYRKVPKFSDTKKLFCNQPITHITGPNLSLLHQKDANGKANSEDPDQTASLVGAV